MMWKGVAPVGSGAFFSLSLYSVDLENSPTNGVFFGSGQNGITGPVVTTSFAKFVGTQDQDKKPMVMALPQSGQ